MELTVPNVFGFVMLRFACDGLAKFGWFKTLKRSAANLVFSRSQIFVSLLRLKSRLRYPRPRMGFALPLRPSLDSKTGRKLVMEFLPFAKKL